MGLTLRSVIWTTIEEMEQCKWGILTRQRTSTPMVSFTNRHRGRSRHHHRVGAWRSWSLIGRRPEHRRPDRQRRAIDSSRCDTRAAPLRAWAQELVASAETTWGEPLIRSRGRSAKQRSAAIGHIISRSVACWGSAPKPISRSEEPQRQHHVATCCKADGQRLPSQADVSNHALAQHARR